MTNPKLNGSDLGYRTSLREALILACGQGVFFEDVSIHFSFPKL
jgi:hypothetical protein